MKSMNDAIIGGKNIVASYTKNGELLRLMYDRPDYRQFIDFFHTGLKINESNIIYLHQDVNNHYNQYYEKDTNVLNTEIINTYFNLKIKQTDFVSLKKSVLIKRYVFENKGNIELDVSFLIHSGLISEESDKIGSKILENSLIQYGHNENMCIFSKSEIQRYQLNDTKNNIETGVIHDKDYIGMSSDSSISYQIGVIKPGETKELEMFIYLNKNEKNEEKLLKDIFDIKKTDTVKEQASVERYWRRYVKDHVNIELKEENTQYNKKFNQVYKRSILLFPLLMNTNTGGIVAGVEVDEKMNHSGRYCYCWPRDAVFITKALDKLKMYKETEKFYKNFCKNTQKKNGMWEQRFFSDGRLAPCWGYQIDETASVVYGVYEHFKENMDIKFLKDTLKICENATKFLCIYMDNILGVHDTDDVVKNEIEKEYHTENRNKLPPSYDIWEMNEGVHLYSLSSIYGAFTSMLEIYKNIEPEYTENRLKLESINKLKVKITHNMKEIKKYIFENMVQENTKTLKRNCNDDLTDISMVGAVVPFGVFDINEKLIINTIEKINMTLRTYTGGYLRFEKDHYMGGKNPWPIATLWIAMYYRKTNDIKKEQECVDFVVRSSNEHGFLGEQVNNETMSPSWVNGLAWSHAMFILLAK